MTSQTNQESTKQSDAKDSNVAKINLVKMRAIGVVQVEQFSQGRKGVAIYQPGEKFSVSKVEADRLIDAKAADKDENEAKD